MRFFVDTANVEDIKKANDMGVICGVTTNPSLIAKEGRDFNEVIKEIAQKKPYYFVMRDSSMANDSVATNFEQIFATFSPDTVRKVL